MGWKVINQDDLPEWMQVDEELLGSAKPVARIAVTQTGYLLEHRDTDGEADFSAGNGVMMVLDAIQPGQGELLRNVYLLTPNYVIGLVRSLLFALPDDVKAEVAEEIEGMFPTGVVPSEEVLRKMFQEEDDDE